MPSPRWVLSGTRVVGAGQAVVPVWSEAVRWGEGVFETVGVALLVGGLVVAAVVAVVTLRRGRGVRVTYQLTRPPERE